MNRFRHRAVLALALLLVWATPSGAIDIQNSVTQTVPFNIARSDPGVAIWIGCPGLWSGHAASTGVVDPIAGRAWVAALAWVDYTSLLCTGAFAEAEENVVIGNNSFVCLRSGSYSVTMQGGHSGMVALHVPVPQNILGGAAARIQTTFRWVMWDDTTSAAVYNHAEGIDEQSTYINDERYLFDQDDHWAAQWSVQLVAGHSYSVWTEVWANAHAEGTGASGGAWAASYFAQGGLDLGPWSIPWDGYIQLDSITIQDQNPDVTAPQTTCTPEGATYCGTGPVELSAVDDEGGYGVAVTRYRVGTGSWLDYTGPFTVTGSGNVTVEYYSVDRAGNTEDPHGAVFHLEQAAAQAVLSSPADGATVVDPVVPFRWAADPQASMYLLQVATMPDFSTSLLQIGIPQAQYDAPGLPLYTTLYWRVQAQNSCGAAPWSDAWSLRLGATAVGDDASIPVASYLRQNHPNPFNPTTSISFGLSHDDRVTIEVFAVDGSRLRTLVSAPYPAGRYTVEWDGKDQRGATVSSGIYFYRLRAGDFVQTRKMTRLD